MYFFYNDIDSKKWEKGSRLLEREDYQRFLQFLYKKKDERVILRDIQQLFGEDAASQRELDMLVDLGVILRKDRSYFFAVPMVTHESVMLLKQELQKWLLEPEQQEIVNQLQLYREMLDQEFSQFFSGELFSFLLIRQADSKREKIPFVLAKEPQESVDLTKDLEICYQMNTDTFCFESIGMTFSWAKYFRDRIHRFALEKEEEQQIFEKIGDVNAFFFLDTLGKKIVQIKMRQGFKERRYHLWTDVLIQTGEVEETEAGLLYQLPVYSRKELRTLQEKQTFYDSEHLYEVLMTSAEQSFEKEPLVPIILQSLLLENLSSCTNQKGSSKWLVLEKE